MGRVDEETNAIMIHVIAVPYDSGRRGERMGAGPLRLLDAGVVRRIKATGHEVQTTVVEISPELWPAEIAAAFDLAARVAVLVREAIAAGAFPLVLSGNCGPAAIGCVSGIPDVSRVFWFDAHGDFNTPETSLSGSFEGMCLNYAVQQFQPASVTLLGTRDLDPEEPGVRVIRSASFDPDLFHPSGRVYPDIDIDVLDPSVSPGASYTTPGGLQPRII